MDKESVDVGTSLSQDNMVTIRY